MLSTEVKNIKMLNYLEYMECIAKTNIKYLNKEITAEKAMEIIYELTAKMVENLEELKRDC
ncbi:hypothetical protein COO03_05015 [Bacillus sp. AFS098217]|uniref:hypothetical protein n=1 Tax=Bacillus sp. AFS098217 TaxID=2033868 RepID=UPI000BEBC308|nr:hypothetical protein [Bacillus sp. AFS098217]PEB54603.1 hypothetical protein COO03_05015 [Bacillus sp. AFS098217]